MKQQQQSKQKIKPSVAPLKLEGFAAVPLMPPTLASAGLDRSGSMSPLTSLGSESPRSLSVMDADEVPPLDLMSSSHVRLAFMLFLTDADTFLN